MKKLCLLLFAFMLTTFTACEKEDNTKPDIQPKEFLLTAQMVEVIGHSNDFGIRFFTEVAREERENLMLSPLSASAALTMLLNGCGGETYNQIRDMLGYPADLDISGINEAYKSLIGQLVDLDPKVRLALAHAVFYRLDLEVKPPFLQAMRTGFDAHIEALDFGLPSALDVINGWAGDNTEGRIPKVLETIDPNTVMFLMNALYFKGDWTYQFDKKETQDFPFYLAGGEQVNVPTMLANIELRSHQGSQYRAMELPYGQTNFSMVVVVPNGPLHDFYNDFTATAWNELTSSLDEQAVPVETVVRMPKFSFSYEKFLNDELIRMGMVDAFNSRTADLSGISEENLFVSFVKQDTFVEVNEEGTEAAAVTTVAIDRDSTGPPFFLVNKPFIFAIRERMTNTILFIGSVMNPLENEK